MPEHTDYNPAEQVEDEKDIEARYAVHLRFPKLEDELRWYQQHGRCFQCGEPMSPKFAAVGSDTHIRCLHDHQEFDFEARFAGFLEIRRELDGDEMQDELPEAA